MKIKVGDKVIVISGSRKDKNKQGTVLKTFKETNSVVVEGVNVKKKVTRDPNGKKTMVDIEFPIHASNVLLYDATTQKGTRVGYVTKDGKKVRIAKASGTELK
ncbi:50S ribosomal protein L24 [Patescibacteria group bacterium]|nr:50S ribosomal protein L24 [Patescibacteria group bacterium]